jgi:hypothetical protein
MTAIFLVALVWAIYVALVNGDPLPIWAWLGVITLLAAAVGLGVAVAVYRGVSREVGPFDFGPSRRVTGQLQKETQQIEANGARALRADIRMTQGILQLMGGTADVMEAAFTYDDADWKMPDVAYSVDAAGLGDLVVKQRATGRPAMHQGRSEWFILLNQDLPTELAVKVGAGKAELTLVGMALTRLRVEGGVGELALDLSGAWRQSMDVFVKAGVGDMTLRLPRNAGARVQSTVGLGSMHAPGLAWDGEAYVNALYGQSAVSLEITVEGGMGKVALQIGD